MRTNKSIRQEIDLMRAEYATRALRIVLYVALGLLVFAIPFYWLLGIGIPLGPARRVQMVNGKPALVEKCRFFTAGGVTLRDMPPAKDGGESHC